MTTQASSFVPTSGEQSKKEESTSLVSETQTRVQNLSEAAHNTLHEITEGTRQKAAEAAAAASDTLDTALTVTGEKLETLAHTLREQAPVPIRDLAYSTATALEHSSQFLHDSDIQTLQQDIAVLVQRHPFKAFFAGVATGYLLGRALGRS